MRPRNIVPLILVSAIVLLLSPSVLARESVFSQDIISGESIDLDDFTFIVTLNKYANSIFVNAGTMFQNVQIETCEDMESFDICFYNVSYDEEENQMYIDMEIFRKKPDITVTKTMNETELFVGSEAIVTLTITNAGDNAEKVIMTDEYPNSTEVYDMEGNCQFHEGEVYWQSHMDNVSEKVCSFTILLKEEIHKSMSAKVQYWDGFKWQEVFSNTLTLDVQPTVTFDARILREDYEIDGASFDYDEDNADAYVGETIRIVMNISNLLGKDLKVASFDVNLPASLKYVGVGNVRFNFENASGNRSSYAWGSDKITVISDAKLRWTGTLDGNLSSKASSKRFILQLKGTKSGVQDIVSSIDYSIDDDEVEDVRFAEYYHEIFSISDPGISFRITIYDPSKRFIAPTRLSDSDEDTDTIDLEALHKYRFTGYVQNLNPFVDIEDAVVKINTSFADFGEMRYSVMEAEKQKIPYSVEIIPANVATDSTLPLNFSISYTNYFGDGCSNFSEFTFNVKRFKDITITSESSETDVLAGNEESEITISLANDRLVDIRDVYVHDIIPDWIDVEGAHSQRLKLIAETDTQVYKYRITPPIVHNKTYFNITTEVSFFDPDLQQDFNITQSNEFAVEIFEPSLTVTVVYDEPETMTSGIIIPATYTVTNAEESEVIRDITLRFPVQTDWDTIGPRTFYIDKLDPDESAEVKNVVRFRPKTAGDAVTLNSTVVEYYDDYGNMFTENTTETDFDIVEGLITGPVIFVASSVKKASFNISEQISGDVDLSNSGPEDMSVILIRGDDVMNLSLPAGETQKISYSLKYDKAGNYTLPSAVVKFDYFGQEAYTGADSIPITVALLSAEGAPLAGQTLTDAAQPAAAQQDSAAAQEAVISADLAGEPQELSFEEWNSLNKGELVNRAIKYSLIGLAGLGLIGLIAAYFYFRKGRVNDKGFIEEEETEEES